MRSSAEVGAVSRRLRAHAGERVREIVPGARSILIVFSAPPDDADRRWLEETSSDAAHAVDAAVDATAGGSALEIPVRYDGADLAAVARRAGLTVDAAIALHAGATYLVAFVGFQPGFAYLEGLPERLWTPRLASPRTRVPPGAVAIGGEWTGIYPFATPGGWNLIGQTDLTLFDPRRSSPALLETGLMVRMVPR